MVVYLILKLQMLLRKKYKYLSKIFSEVYIYYIIVISSKNVFYKLLLLLLLTIIKNKIIIINKLI